MTSEQDTMVTLPFLKDLTYREWHAFVEGLYVGLRWGTRQHEYSQEKHYWRIGYVLGTTLRYSLVAAVYYYLTNDSNT